MDLFIGKPTFQKKLRSGDILVDGIDPSAIYLGHKKLLPKGALEELVTIEGIARRTLSDRSLEFPISGARFIQYSALAEVVRSLTALKERWNAGVVGLVNDYPTLREAQLVALDAQAEKLQRNALAPLSGKERDARELELQAWLATQKSINRSMYPRAEDLTKLFKFEWRMFRVSSTSGTEELTGLKASEIAQAQEAIQRDLQKWVRAAATEMHKVLGEAALNAKNMLEKQGKMTPRNMKPLFDAFNTFKAVDFTGSSTIQDVIGRIQAKFEISSPDGETDFELSANAATGQAGVESGFNQLLATISELATDSVAENAGIQALGKAGEFRRLIEV